MSRLPLALGLLVFASNPEAARGDSSMAVTRIPLSARQQACGGAYGSYDVLGVVENPASLATQRRMIEVNAADQYLFSSGENVLGLGVGWMNGSADTGAWGVAVVAAQVFTASFNEVDELGNATGRRVSPVGRRFDLATAYQRSSVAVGASMGTAAESYGSLPDDAGKGPSGVQLAVGTLASFDRWSAGAAVQFRGLGGPAGIPGVVSAGGSVEEAGLRFNASMLAPLAGPAGPAVLAGFRWPVSDSFDLQGAYNASFATGVAASLGGSVRIGFSVRSTRVGMDYTLVVPLSSGLGMTHLITLGWSFGNRRSSPQASPPVPSPAESASPNP